MHFLPFNPVDKRTAITYIDENGEWHRSSKGAPEQVIETKIYISETYYMFSLLPNTTFFLKIIELCNLQGEARRKAHEVIDGFAERGLRSLGVAQQVCNRNTHHLKIVFTVVFVFFYIRLYSNVDCT